MPTVNLIYLLDDCPRTKEALRSDYCRITQCLYYQGKTVYCRPAERPCSHPKAGNSSIERFNRLTLLEKLVSKKGEK